MIFVMNELSFLAEDIGLTPEQYQYYKKCIEEIDVNTLQVVKDLCQAAYERGYVDGLLEGKEESDAHSM